jgi:hypothetical protein
MRIQVNQQLSPVLSGFVVSGSRRCKGGCKSIFRIADPLTRFRVVSSVGRASALHAECRQFEPVTTHHTQASIGNGAGFLFLRALNHLSWGWFRLMRPGARPAPPAWAGRGQSQRRPSGRVKANCHTSSIESGRSNVTLTMAPLLKHCTKCQTSRAPEGGVELRPTRWFCARCWMVFSKNRT